jgi:hypothetical protein
MLRAFRAAACIQPLGAGAEQRSQEEEKAAGCLSAARVSGCSLPGERRKASMRRIDAV